MLILNAILISLLFVFLVLYGTKLIRRRLEVGDDGQGKIRQFFRQRNLDALGVKAPVAIIVIYVTLYFLVTLFVKTRVEVDVPLGGLLLLTVGVLIIAFAILQLPISILKRMRFRGKDNFAHIVLDVGKTTLIFLIGAAIILCVTNFWLCI